MTAVGFMLLFIFVAMALLLGVCILAVQAITTPQQPDRDHDS